MTRAALCRRVVASAGIGPTQQMGRFDMTQTDAPALDNGVNIEAIRGARQALTDAPEAAQFEWRASCEWVNGTHSRSVITDYSGLGQHHAHRQPFSIEADHPEVFASEDN